MSSDVLVHHGVKGMKWGVRRYQNPDGSLTALGRQRQLRDLDSVMRVSTVGASNSRGIQEAYRAKAARAHRKGKAEKAARYEEVSKRAGKHAEAYTREYLKAGQEMLKALSDAEQSGFSWKASAYEFSSAGATKRGRQQLDAALKDCGKLPLSAGLYNWSNAASGNQFTVRETSSLSPKKQRAWEDKHRLNRYSPQRVEYYYY